MNPLPILRTSAFSAEVIDNSARGIHPAGLNGLASLVPTGRKQGIIGPGRAGLNYEIIALTGMPPFSGTAVSPFEPRAEPMRIESADARGVVLVQPETSHAQTSARIEFRAQEPHYIHQHVELVFHRRFTPPGVPMQFHSLWANYINAPPDIHIYLKRDLGEGGELEGWIGLAKLDHGPADWHIRPLPADRELSPAEHLAAMQTGRPEVFGYGPVPPTDPLTLGREPLPGPLPFYYGLWHDLLFLMMFKQPEQFRFAYSPNGGHHAQPWNPAWDYVLFEGDVQLGRTYAWDLCLAVKPYAGRRDVLAEVGKFLGA
jgi:hypothetical protein